MDIQKDLLNEYKRWIDNVKDAELMDELISIKGNYDEINESFYKELDFGTSGMRGVLGVGTNRLNTYVIRRSNLALASHINRTCDDKSVVIAYDSRKNSRRFAEETANLMSSMGIKAYLFSELTPVPVLSYSIDKLSCSYGIMITASHNPSVYNGYKVYGKYGYQIIGSDLKAILEEQKKFDFFDEVKVDVSNVQVLDDSIKKMFINDVLSFSPQGVSEEAKKNLRIVYTPLNGTGNKYVRQVLAECGFDDINIVKSQELPDENFTTCKSPNPEKMSAYTEAFEVLEEAKADIILSTDPDCDRFGCALIHDGMKVNLTGNQIGILLFDFLCKFKDKSASSICVSSIVSSPLIDKIAEENEIRVIRTLTGFKYIGAIIADLIEKGRASDYFFGFEESNGFLASPFVRDKDAVSTAMLIAYMAAQYKAEGLDLIDRLKCINDAYGRLIERNKNFVFEGIKGEQQRSKIMEYFRAGNLKNIADFDKCIDYLYDDTGMPSADVLQMHTKSGSTFIIRPSGTEPKIKLYMYLNPDELKIAKKFEEIIKSFNIYETEKK
ncbi:MAG: phospho-sugar mutase [Eubacterium sp.]|nr:phospho-sugar mutase [Eubacterium sp.]